MSDSFRYGNKKEINYEQFVQKMKNVQTSTNADLWKLFGVFDRDKNGKIENTTKELEVKSLFNFIKNYAGEDNVLDDSEIEKMLKDPQIASQFENKEQELFNVNLVIYSAQYFCIKLTKKEIFCGRSLG